MMGTVCGLLAIPLLLRGQVPTVESAEFSKDLQVAALTATVQVRNKTQVGSGVVVGKSGPFVYILTAQHLVKDARGVEVAVFTKESFPKPKTVYEVEVVAEKPGLVDLALLRLSTRDALPAAVRVCPERQVPTRFTGLAVGCDRGEAPVSWTDKFAGKKSVRREESKETSIFWYIERLPVQGRSGGPLIDGRGLLVGVCSGGSRQTTYFTHVEEIQRFLKRNGYGWLTEEKGSP